MILLQLSRRRSHKHKHPVLHKAANYPLLFFFEHFSIMAPNVKPITMSAENELITANDVDQAKLTELLDKQADTDGLKNMNADTEDWTDVKHSERKKRDRILDGKIIYAEAEAEAVLLLTKIYPDLQQMAF